MPDILQEPEEEQETEQPQMTQPAAQIDVGGDASQQTAPTRPSSRGSGMGKRLTTLRKYISRNVPQTQQMVGQLKEGITGKYEGLKGRLTGIGTQAQQKQAEESARLQRGQELLKPEGGFLQDVTKFTGETGGKFAQFGETPEERMAAWKRLKSGEREQYQMQEAPEVQKQLSELQKQTEATRTEGGRFGLLREQFTRPGYSRGQQRLDQLLLQGKPGAARELMQTQDLAKSATQQLGGLQERIAARNQAIKEQAQARQAEIQGLGLGERRGEIEAQSAQDLRRTIAERAAETQRFKEGLGTAFDAEEAAKLGMTEGQLMFGIDPRQYIKQKSSDATLAGITSQEEMARYQALGQLADSVGGAYADPTRAGTYEAGLAVDPAMQEVIAAKQAEFEKEYKGAHKLGSYVGHDLSNVSLPNLQNQIKLINEARVRSGLYAIPDKYLAQSPQTRMLVREINKRQGDVESVKQRYGMGEGSEARTGGYLQQFLKERGLT